MPAPSPRALVVDDEAVIRSLLSTMLRQQGIACDQASDGNEAIEKLAANHYDVVVTDLRMPHMHGHALVTEILARQNRPIIVVHTCVVEPKLAKDLISRGVDDIVFRLTDVGLLATKVKLLLDLRPGEAGDAEPSASTHAHVDSATARPVADESPTDDRPLTLPEFGRQLARVSVVLPISHAALDVYNISRDSNRNLSQIAAVIQGDASLAAEVLRLANNPLFNASNSDIHDLDEAVRGIGQRRVGELALAVNAMAAAAPDKLPWMDLEFTWKRSMAAGVALEALIDVGRHSQVEDGLLLSATIHPLGRVVLGMLLPRHYEAMISACQRDNEALQTLERRLLPISHAELMAHLLGTWQVPPEVCLPLKHLLDEYSSLVRLPEPVRRRSELVQIAVLAGRLAVDRWESWDWVQLTPPGVLKRLRLDDVGDVVAQIRADLGRLGNFRPSTLGTPTYSGGPPPRRPLPYCNLNDDGADLLIELLPSLGLAPVPCSPDDLHSVGETAIVNCLGVPPAKLAAIRAPREMLVAVAAGDNREVYSRFAVTAALPASFGAFRHEVLSALDQAPPVVLQGELAASARW